MSGNVQVFSMSSTFESANSNTVVVTYCKLYNRRVVTGKKSLLFNSTYFRACSIMSGEPILPPELCDCVDFVAL